MFAGDELRSTTVVKPCDASMSRHARLSASAGRWAASANRSSVKCTCTFQNPGNTVAPRPSTRWAPAGTRTDPAGPSAAMRPSFTTTVPSSTGAAVADGITRACSTTQLSPAPASSANSSATTTSAPRPGSGQV